MHFALPPRKTSFPPPYARVSAQNSLQRKRQIQYLAYLILGVLSICLLFTFFSAGDFVVDDGTISKDASVLIVTVLDESSMSNEYIHMIKNNRDEYAARHGYKTFYTNASTYQDLTEQSPKSWALIPALRHALSAHPDSDYLWSLTPHAVITNLSASLHDHVFSRLPELMRKDIPVVPPDSVIHTFSHLRPSQVYLILTQDKGNVAPTSFILRNTRNVPVSTGQPKDTWSEYFLDAWFDPLYRAYAFQKAENHALEHIIQWHPTILAKLVMVEQRVLNSYVRASLNIQDGAKLSDAEDKSLWRIGDLVVNLKDCHNRKGRDCVTEMKKYLGIWHADEPKADTDTGPGSH